METGPLLRPDGFYRFKSWCKTGAGLIGWSFPNRDAGDPSSHSGLCDKGESF